MGREPEMVFDRRLLGAINSIPRTQIRRTLPIEETTGAARAVYTRALLTQSFLMVLG